MIAPTSNRPTNLSIVLFMIATYVGVIIMKPDIVPSLPAWMMLVAGASFATAALWTYWEKPSRHIRIVSYALLAINGVLQFFSHSLPPDSSIGRIFYRSAVAFVCCGAILLNVANAKLKRDLR